MKYQLVIRPSARKSYLSLPKKNYLAVRDAIFALCTNPRPHGCKKLIDRDGWRIRVGVYRVIYRIDDSQGIVTVTHIGHRSDVYE
jgi:mRNA interferase RelE/StbE